MREGRTPSLELIAWLLSTTMLVWPGWATSQAAPHRVGVVLEKDGEVLLRKSPKDTSISALAPLEQGATILLRKGATAKFVHNVEGATYVIKGPAVVTILEKGLKIDPVSAKVSRASSSMPVSLSAPGAGATAALPADRRVGGEALDRSRAGLVAGPETKRSQISGQERAAADKATAQKVAPARAAAAMAEKAAQERVAQERASLSRTEQEERRSALERMKREQQKHVAVQRAEAEAAGKPVPKVDIAIAKPPEVLLYEKALALENNGQMKEALRVYRQAARAGSGLAAKRLGDYYSAQGTPEYNYQEALSWYTIARAKGIDIGVTKR